MHLESGLRTSAGQISVKGLKHQNEDSVGIYVPKEPLLTVKGMVAIVADGVSSAEAGKEASETCVKNFISDFFSTPDSWTVKNSAQKVLTALNRWLYGQGVGYLQAEHGYISTMSTLVIKSRVAHIFHIGDSRVYRLRGNNFEQLTHDHSARVSKDSTYLTRAMGMDLMLDVDYYSEDVESGDIFFLSTDGIHDFINDKRIKEVIAKAVDCKSDEFTGLCESLVDIALENGSDDNLSCQIVRVDALPCPNAEDAYVKLSDLPFPPELSPGMSIDGYHVIKELHASNR
ncbi:PP2C family serine/threonine-protein phosphatase, partial [Oleiphilus sp. HI0123]